MNIEPFVLELWKDHVDLCQKIEKIDNFIRSEKFKEMDDDLRALTLHQRLLMCDLQKTMNARSQKLPRL